MRIVVALGGNALLRRGEKLTDENQRANVVAACRQLAPLALTDELVVSHGNGPQVGLLALYGPDNGDIGRFHLDVLGAQTQGMIGYLVEQGLENLLPPERPVATLLTIVEVDPADPAFDRPTKPIGPFYDHATAERLERRQGWTFHPDGDAYRRVVASPAPQRIVEIVQIERLLTSGCAVICAGGGGVPAARGDDGRLHGADAVIDKDEASCLLATSLTADRLVLATDADAVYLDFATPGARAIAHAHPSALAEHAPQFAEGSMRPKVDAACRFVRETGREAMIGALDDIEGVLAGRAGTRISRTATGIELRAP